MKIEHFNLKFSILFFYTNRLKESKYENCKVLITTPFGFVKGIPDFNIPTYLSHNDFLECVCNNNFLIRDYMIASTQENELAKQSTEDDICRPALKGDELVVIKDATIYSNGNTLQVDSFTLFIDEISGISLTFE